MGIIWNYDHTWDSRMGEIGQHVGVSENSVPLNPMVLLIIIPFLNGYFIGNIPNTFRQTHVLYPKIQLVAATRRSGPLG